MLDDFLVRAGLAGVGVAIAAAPLGCFVVWRRMAYFGDATAHAALLGVALSLSFSISIFVSVLAVCLAMAMLVSTLAERGYALDTVLGVLAHAALAFGLVAVSLLSGVRVDLSAYLFGDILAVTREDLTIIWGGAIAIVALISWRWQPLLTATLSPELARASGLSPRKEQLVLTLALATVVAVAIKVVGALLIISLMLIPAAAARPFATNPEVMVVTAGGIGAASALGGLWASFQFDTPTGPSIVCTAATIFFASTLIGLLRRTS
ncbi:hypothetical protein E2K80_00275 [Rhodophyticola sp. CCM32]|uniref:metal ABC transporter permease n=1 Tax=Rhodophyticola sp. CCM32 TaxID=2916397 RepID=UPI00107EF0F2|nr:metal ABC transporter permease [Rhodophyticola sp. CCM32]QBX99356.1 hypothetical protein E2K80_00275 [Rhodophyticola sp. CCM32]